MSLRICNVLVTSLLVSSCVCTQFCTARPPEGSVPRPALRLVVSQQLLREMIAQPVDRTAPVVQTVLGTSVQGIGRTTGNVDIQLVPCDSAARMRFSFVGSTVTDAIGHTGRVRSTSVSRTHIQSRAEWTIDRKGVVTGPAEAEANCVLNVCRVEVLPPRHRIGHIVPTAIIQRQAWRRILESRPQRERIIAQRAARQAAQRMDERLPALAETVEHELTRWLLHPLAELAGGADPGPDHAVRFSTTSEHLTVSYGEVGPNLLEEESPRTSVLASSGGPTMAAISLHESAAATLVNHFLAGHKLTLNSADSIWKPLKKVSTHSPAAQQYTQVTLDPHRPIEVRFRGQCVWIRLRGQQFLWAGQETGPFELELCLRCQRSQQGVHLIPESLPQITLADTSPWSAWRALQIKALNVLLLSACHRQLMTEGLALPTLSPHKTRIGICRVDVQEGWLHLGFAACDAGATESPSSVPSSEHASDLHVATVE